LLQRSGEGPEAIGRAVGPIRGSRLAVGTEQPLCAFAIELVAPASLPADRHAAGAVRSARCSAPTGGRDDQPVT
jgi:hypothetical protein